MAAKETTKPEEQRYEINVMLANDGEPTTIFVGADGRDFLIKRGENVIVPASVLGVLDNAVKGVDERDPHDEMRSIVVNRKRFSYTVVRAL